MLDIIIYFILGMIFFAIFMAIMFYDLSIIDEIKLNFLGYLNGIIGEFTSLFFSYYSFKIFLFLLIFLASICLGFVLISIYEAYFENAIFKLALKNIDYKKYPISEIILKVISWNFYRLKIVFLPIIKMLVFTFSALLLIYLGFNFIITIISFSLSFTVFVATFSIISFLGLIFASLLKLFWRIILTEFALECAVSEPDLLNEYVLKRSKKFIFQNPYNLIFLSLNYAFIFALLFQFGYLAVNSQILTYENMHYILFVLFFDFIAWLILKCFKIYLYQENLVNYYNKIVFSFDKSSDIFKKLYI
ncbi:MAG: hypothetical protein PHV68_04075 [Candidatus Gastranaerophilales bacterium]|nr:hypothetical protein [Candidatus Gastranaerophilales bacterium]